MFGGHPALIRAPGLMCHCFFASTDACGTSEAAQLEQRLRSLGCELVTLRSRLPPALHHSRPTTPPAPIINTTTTNNTTLTASSANSSFHTANNSNNNNNNKNNATTPSNKHSSPNTSPASPSPTTATNNNKNVQGHNGTAQLLPPNFPAGGGTPSSGGSESRITLNSSNLADGLNSSQSFLAGKFAPLGYKVTLIISLSRLLSRL